MKDSQTYTEDRLLDGQILLRQPRRGYRAGIDPVLLAASLALKPGARALEMGCGPGGALLTAAYQNPHCKFKGLELDAEAVRLAQTSIILNDMEDRVWAVEADALSFKAEQAYDCVFFNPPFFDDPSSLRAPAEEKTAAWITQQPLSDWIRAGLVNLKSKGVLTLVHRADRLEDALAALTKNGAGSMMIKPIHPRLDKPAKRILVRAIKGGHAPLQLLAPLIMHDDQGDKYSPMADDILRGRAHIEWV